MKFAESARRNRVGELSSNGNSAGIADDAPIFALKCRTGSETDAPRTELDIDPLWDEMKLSN
jgi:hypothetical protein